MRTISGDMRNAIDNPVSYKLLTRAEVYPSRIFFDALTSDYGFAGADALGAIDAPVEQDIEYSSVSSGLVTFFEEGGSLLYAIQGSLTKTTTSYSAAAKPGIIGSKAYVYDGTNIRRYSIDWSAIASLSVTPFTQDAIATPTLTPLAVHGLNDTQAVMICEDDGGFRAVILDGTTEITAPNRFMFPKRVEWNGSARTMREMAVFSGAAKSGSKTYVFISNASIGTVDAIYYDSDTGIWSDIYVAVPTDLDVSQCETRVCNAYEHNGTIYLMSQFVRTDAYTGQQPYSLLMQSTDGRTFALDRFVLVSNIGYRFLARVGSDNKLYLGNCNRVCHSAITWVFDGVNGTNSLKLDLDETDILSLSENNLGSANLVLRSGKEEYFGSTYVEEDARCKLFMGMDTTVGDEYVLYGTYIIENIDTELADGSRGFKVNMVNESQWKLSGLSMPFYAEIFGKSGLFDPMTELSGQLYTAPGGSRTVGKLQVDFWNHEGYNNTALSITGLTSYDSGGVAYHEASGPHKLGMIIKDDLKIELGLDDNPLLTADNVDVKIYGWCHPETTGQINDEVNVVLITVDDAGVETEHVTDAGLKFPVTWPDTQAGNSPININVSGLTAGDRIKKVGVVFWNSTVSSWFNIARVEIVSNIEVPVTFSDANTPWEAQEDGTFKVPSAGRPFIMFSQKPYNAWNFSISAKFSNTITGAITGYPTACGLLGHAEDASNYICARYNKTNSKVELVVARGGLETELANVTPGFTINDEHQIHFMHKDGTYTVQMYNDTNTRFETVLTYDWASADGFMYTSRVATMKCGIYGNISAPYVRILGYYNQESEGKSSADGFPVDPVYDITDFPATGQLRVGNNVYGYTSKITHPTECRGPYQFRQMNVYKSPYGSGPGCQTRDFNWGASTSLITGKLIAMSSGTNFICSGAKWDVFNSTGGVVQYFYNRAMYYSDNPAIAEYYNTLSTKVWIVGGFTGISLADGTKAKHPEGEFATLELAGELKCHWYQGAGGPDDTTISDLIERVSDLCGAQANFPGDYTNASLAVSGTTDVYQDDYADGFDLRYEIASPTTHEILTNIRVIADNYEDGDTWNTDTGSKIVFTSLGAGEYQIEFVSTPSAKVLYSAKYTNGTADMRIRILFHQDFCSIYHNDQWVATVCLDELEYNQNTYVDIDASGTFTMLNIRCRELSDWREAIYIDLETDGRSAIRSIIQERPVSMIPNPDGSLDYWYYVVRDQINAVKDPRSHSKKIDVPAGAASDSIIYGYEEVVTYQNPAFAKDLGFSTKLMRMPNLTVGAVEATIIAMKLEHQRRIMHTFEIRPDISLITGDRYTGSYTASGTGTVVNFDVIVETVSLRLQQAGRSMTSTMQVKGREYSA